MANGNAIAALRKAHQATAIVQDTWTLQKFYNKNEENEVARMNLIGIESKYVPHLDKRNAPAGTDGAGNLGRRTRFLLANGESIGTMSNGANRLFTFFAQLMGYTGEENFVHIDFTGNVIVDISVLDLGDKKHTYNFEIVEEGSEIHGFQDYLPTVNTLFLDSGEAVDTTTGEVTEEPTELETVKVGTKRRVDK